MRIVFLIPVMLLCFNTNTFSQNTSDSKSTLRIGINVAFFGSGDVFGSGLSGEYVYDLNNFLSITPRLMVSIGNDNHQMDHNLYEYHQITTLGTSVSARFTPFAKSFKRLKLDIGLLYQNFTKSGGLTSPDEYYNSYSGTTTYYSENLFGFLGSINLNVIDTDTFESGFRLELLTSLSEGYLNSESIQAGVFFGVRF